MNNAKKYLIAIFAFFVLTMAGIVVTTNILESQNGIEDGVFSKESLKKVFSVDKTTIEEQRKASGKETPANTFLADVDTTYVNDVGDTSGKTVTEGVDTDYFHASMLTEKDLKIRESYGLDTENIKAVMEENAGKFCYDLMDESLHQLYAEILIATKARATEVPLCTREPDELDYAYRCVLNDHPEIFTVNGYTCVRHSANDIPVKVAYGAKYTMTSTEESINQAKIDSYTRNYKKGIRETFSDYDKVKYTYQYLIMNTEYVLDSPENQNICSVMIYNKSVCLGYAKSMQYLLNEVGVSSTIVEGYAANGDPHAWNMVHIANAYYFVDVTWGDSSYTNGSSAVKLLSGVNYDYLNITSDELSHSHVIDNVVPIPRCVEIRDNYYVKEGLYFDSINANALSTAFKNAIEIESDHITIKCSNDTTFQEMKYYLLDKQKVFDYLPEGTETISYGENQDLHTLTFLLN